MKDSSAFGDVHMYKFPISGPFNSRSRAGGSAPGPPWDFPFLTCLKSSWICFLSGLTGLWPHEVHCTSSLSSWLAPRKNPAWWTIHGSAGLHWACTKNPEKYWIGFKRHPVLFSQYNERSNGLLQLFSKPLSHLKTKHSHWTSGRAVWDESWTPWGVGVMELHRHTAVTSTPSALCAVYSVKSHEVL